MHFGCGNGEEERAPRVGVRGRRRAAHHVTLSAQRKPGDTRYPQHVVLCRHAHSAGAETLDSVQLGVYTSRGGALLVVVQVAVVTKDHLVLAVVLVLREGAL